MRFETSSDGNLGIGKIAKQGVSLPSVSLGDFLGTSERQSLFIKMDIEGAEWPVIKSAQDALRSWDYPLSILVERKRSFARTALSA